MPTTYTEMEMNIFTCVMMFKRNGKDRDTCIGEFISKYSTKLDIGKDEIEQLFTEYETQYDDDELSILLSLATNK